MYDIVVLRLTLLLYTGHRGLVANKSNIIHYPFINGSYQAPQWEILSGTKRH